MKKRIWSVILALSMVLSLVPVFSLQASATVTQLDGSGTQDDPWLIHNEEELIFFRGEVNNYTSSGSSTSGITNVDCFAILSDITLTSNWTPIDKFYGTLDGRNHTISNMTVVAADGGFFVYLYGPAKVSNLHIKNGNVTNTKRNLATIVGAGGLAGDALGEVTVSNCSYEGNVTSAMWYAGGLFAVLERDNGKYPVITDCFVSGTITTHGHRGNQDAVGGITGYVFSDQNANTADSTCTIERCYSEVEFTCIQRPEGNITGFTGATIRASEVTGVTTTGGYIGRVDGSPVKVKDCYSAGTGQEFSYITTFVAFNPSVEFENCHVYDTNYARTPRYSVLGAHNGGYCVNDYYTGGTFTAANCYQLDEDSDNHIQYAQTDESNNVVTFGDSEVLSKSAADFTSSTFTDWDFTNTWVMGTSYPILKQYTIPSDVTRDITYYSDDNNDIDLTEYFHLVLDQDKDYDAHERFNYSFVSGNATVPKKVWNNTTYQWETSDDTISLARIEGDTLILNTDMPIGTYPNLKIKAESISDEYDDVIFDLNITKSKMCVPVPEITPLTSPRPTYSSTLKLDNIKITDGWTWDDINKVPKNSDGINSEGASDPLYKTTYDVDYDFDITLTYDPGEDYTKYYDLTDLQAAATANGWQLTVDNTGIKLSALDPLVKTSAEAPYTIRYIEVRDADTHVPVSGATVTCVSPAATPGVSPAPTPDGTHHYSDEFPMGSPSPDEDVTNTSGQVYAELSPGLHTLKASAAGYDDEELEVDITPALVANLSSAPIVIYLKKTRAEFHVPKLLIKQEDGTHTATAVPAGKISVTSLNPSITQGWNGGEDTMLADPDTDLTGGLPNNAVFMLKNATDGYSTDEVLYVKAINGVVHFYDDEACTSEITFTGDPAIYAFELADPVYIVTIDNGTDKPNGDKTITAKIEIKNIKATHGSFGLKYDTSVFTLDDPTVGTGDITLGSEIKDIYTVEEEYSGYTSRTWSDSNGYYVFEWHTADDNTELDAESTAKEILTITFTLKNAQDADAASLDWFDIMLWGDTYAAQDYVAAIAALRTSTGDPTLDDMINTEHWRVIDTENDPPYGRGRLDRIKDVVNGVHKGGFYQASVNGILGTAETSFFYDVTTIFNYEMALDNSVLQFHTYEQGNVNANISGANVTIYNTLSPSFTATNATGTDGIASFSVNTASGVYGPNFTYTVTAMGYWSVPLPGDPLPTVTAPTGVVTRIPVPMERKVYHVPKVVNSGMTTVGDADLGGERYAYNGRDFHFRARSAPGYRITTYPTSATVHIISYDGSDETVTLSAADGTLDMYGIFTLDASYLHQETLLDVYNRSTAHTEYSRLLTEDSAHSTIHGYPAVSDFDPSVHPDAEGFRSYNVYIEFDQFDVEEIEYIVEGVTNDYGTVSYSQTNSNYTSGLSVLPLDSGTTQTDHYNLVKTTRFVAGTSVTNHRTGVFTFTPADGCKVERVYINGLREYMYDGLTEPFDYTFNEVDMDCNITVIFTNGDTPTNDSVITLVVGDYGHVDTQTPNLPGKSTPETNLWMTRRVYLKPTDPLVFTVTADDGYNICPVRQETDRVASSFTNLTPNPSDGRYTVNPVNGENIIVYVTFKHPTASPNTTPNRFVKSYVYAGEGVPEPAGVLIYTIYDDIDIFQRANIAHQFKVKGVVLQPFDDLTTVTSIYDHPLPLQNTNTYTYPSITEDITIGSVFAEPTHTVTGIVDLSQRTNLPTSDCLTGAVVTFVRLESDNTTEKPFQVPYVFNTTNDRSTATFTADIPAGHWNVYITKPGYMIYKLTNFEMTAPVSPATSISFGNGKPIVPYIGSTTDGKQITLTDAANIKSGWRIGVNQSVKSQADVDNDGNVNIRDITYVWHNYNRRYVVQDYNYFLSNGSNQTIVGP